MRCGQMINLKPGERVHVVTGLEVPNAAVLSHMRWGVIVQLDTGKQACISYDEPARIEMSQELREEDKA